MYYQKVKPNTTLYIILGLVAVFMGVKIIAFVKGLFYNGGSDNLRANQQTQVELDKLQRSFPTKSLSKPATFYKNVANLLMDEMQYMGTSQVNTMLKHLEGLNENDLKQIYIDFGIRTNKMFGVTFLTGDLFRWFEEELSNYSPLDWGALDKMKQRWSITGLWA